MSFFYNHFGDYMKIYLDVIFLINFFFDFFLLMITSILLRRKVKFKNMILGSLIGALSIFVLFININSFELFIIKIIISLIMVLVTFKYKNIRYTLKNIVYLYFTSMILGGVLYYLNVEFSYKQEGLVFYHDGLSINFVFLILSKNGISNENPNNCTAKASIPCKYTPIIFIKKYSNKFIDGGYND